MPEHKPATYHDGYKMIEFCKVCGQEAPLVGECPGEFIDVNKSKKVDKKPEPS